MNLTKENIGFISGVLVVVSAIPYVFRVWQGKIRPSITSWGLWSVIGFALLVTYRSSGAGANVWPAIFGFINPTVITVLAVVKRGERTKLSGLEWVCIAICFLSLGAWFLLRHDRSLVQWALYAAIVADAFAGFPTIGNAFTRPDLDRPFAWGMFAVAYLLALLAAPEWTAANYVLPIYMFLGAGTIACFLTRFRIRSKIPIKEWI